MSLLSRRRPAVTAVVGLALAASLCPLTGAGATPSPAGLTPTAAAPAYSLQPVSGQRADEAEAFTDPMDITASGEVVLYSADMGSGRPGLLVRDRVAGTTALVDHKYGEPDTVASWRADDAAVSADGTTVVLASEADDLMGDAGVEFGEAYVWRRATQQLTRVARPTAPKGPVVRVDVSGNGSRLVMLVDRDWSEATPSSRIVTIDTETGETLATRTIPTWAGPPTISDDGSTVAWAEDTAEGVSQLHVGPAGSLEPQETRTDWGSGRPSLDRTGSHVLYVDQAKLPVIATRGEPAAQPVQVPDGVTARNARLSSDGSTVVYDDALYDEGGAAASVWSVQLPDGLPVRVAGSDESSTETPLGVRAVWPVVNADGSVIATWLDQAVVAAVRSAGEQDTAAPVWPDGARLTAVPAARGIVRLHWPTATDDMLLKGYDLTADGRPLTNLGPARTSYDVPVQDNDPTPVRYEIRPVDTSGNVGTALATTARGAATLTVEPDGPDALRADWEAVTGRDDITGYRVLRADGGGLAGGSVGDPADLATVADVPLGQTRLVDQGLRLLRWYDVRVDLVRADGSTEPWTAVTSAHTDLPAPGPLTIDDVRSGSARLSWAGAPADVPLAHYVVQRQRQSPDREFGWTDVGTRGPGDEPVLVDSGLQPRASYLWRVRIVLDLDWPTRDWTEAAQASTTGEGITSWHVDAPRTRDDVALVLGSDLVVSAEAEPGLHGEVRLFQDVTPADGAAPEVTLPVHEEPAGQYRSDTYVLDGEALAAVGRAELVLTDGTRTFTRSGTAGPVSGRLGLTIAPSEETLPGLELVLVGPKGTLRQAAAADTSIGVPLSPGRWEVSLVTGDGDVTARQSLDVAAAQPVDLTLRPERHAELAVTLTPPPGQALTAQKVSVRAADGTVLATKPLDLATGTAVFHGLPRRSSVVVSTRLDDQRVQVSQPTAAVDLGVGRHDLTLAAAVLAPATVRAAVTGEREPLAGATVTVRQQVDGRDWQFTGRTAEDGTVSVPALAGDATVRATADRYLGSGATLDLPQSGSREVALDLLRAPNYLIRPEVYTTNAGGQPTAQPMDWSTNIHLHVSLSAGGRTLAAAPAVTHAGNEGDVVRLCANGFEKGLSQACAETRLGADADVPIRIDLTQAGSITAHLVDQSGTAVPTSSARLYRVEAGGLRHVSAFYARDSDPLVGVPEPGVYQVVFAAAAGQSAPLQVSLADGSAVDLGTITLRGGTGTAQGAGFEALPDPVLPGGRVTYRVTLPAGAWPDRTALTVGVPEGTTPAANGVTVDGTPVDATRDGAELTIPLAGSGPVVVRYALDVARTAPAGRLASVVRLAHDFGAHTAEIGTVVGTVTGVTTSGPRVVTAPEVRVTGTAPPGAPVDLAVDGLESAGRATAGPGGRWSATVPLAHAQRGSHHQVVASSTVGERRLVATPYDVRYEPGFVQPTRIVVDNAGVTTAGSRSISFDPRDGVAAFTMVYVPGMPVTVRSEFGEAAPRIYDYVAHVGSAQAPGTCDTTSCTAVVQPAGSAEVGDIWVDYAVDAVPLASVADVDVPTEEELRFDTRAPFNDPQPLESTDEKTRRYQLGATGAEVSATVGGSAGLTYDVTPADELVLARTGAPAYGMSITPKETSDGIELHLKAALPQGFARTAPGALSGAAPGAALKPSPQDLVDLVDVVFKIKAGLQISVDQLKHLFNAGEEEEEFTKMEDYIRSQIEPCSPDIAAELSNDVAFSRATVIYYRLTSDALNGLGLLGGSWTTMAEGMIKFLAETLIGELLDMGIGNMISDEVDTTKARVYGKPRCDKRVKWVPPDFKYPKAKPTWIFDPSGYTYEALAANRVEGVTATVLAGASPEGPWVEWDAAEYGQSNPQQTTAEGRYGWDVTPGWWKVRFEKDGYRTTETEAMEVLPERYDVNVGLHRTAAPAVAGVRLDGDGIAVTFDEWMSVDSVVGGVRVASGSSPVPGIVSPVSAEGSPTGTALARTFRFVPAAPFAAGQRLRVIVPAGTVDHGGVTLAAASVTDLTTPVPDTCRPTALTMSPALVRPGRPVTARAVTAAMSLVVYYRATATGRFRPAARRLAWSGGATAWRFRPRVTTRVYAKQVGCPGHSPVVTVTVRGR
jgi:hypothetical protein